MTILREARSEFRRILWPKIRQSISRYKADAVGDDLENDLDGLRLHLNQQVDAIRSRINRLHQGAAARHTQKWINSVQGSIGVDISAIVSSGELRELMSVASARNARLIGSLSDDIYNRIAGTVLDSIGKGESVKELQGRLQGQFDIAGKRIKTIARDQTAKLTSNLNRFRQEQAGIKKYRWSTSQDERVRPTHEENEGKIFSWSKPPAETGHPGDDINCRCVAIAIVE